MKKNRHWRECWLVLTFMLMVVWFCYPPLPRLQPHEFAVYVTGLLIGTGLVYAVFGRLLVWIYLGIDGIVHESGRSFREAADNRRAMQEITNRLMGQRPDSFERPVRTGVVTFIPPNDLIPRTHPKRGTRVAC